MRLFTRIFPIPVVERVLTKRLFSAVLANCVSSVANQALNAAFSSLSAVNANCLLSSFITTRVLGHYIHGHMHLRCNINIVLDVVVYISGAI